MSIDYITLALFGLVVLLVIGLIVDEWINIRRQS